MCLIEKYLKRDYSEGLEADLTMSNLANNVLENMDYELSFCRKSDYVQYQTLDGAQAPSLLLMSVKVFLVLSQNRLCPVVCPFPPFCNPHSGLINDDTKGYSLR